MMPLLLSPFLLQMFQDKVENAVLKRTCILRVESGKQDVFRNDYIAPLLRPSRNKMRIKCTSLPCVHPCCVETTTVAMLK